MKRKMFSFRLPEDLIKKLDAEAKKQNRPRSNLVETILMRYVKLKRK